MTGTTTTGATRNVSLHVRQSKPKASYLVSNTQAAKSCARPVYTSYNPKRRKRRLKLYLCSCGRKYDNRGLLGCDVIVWQTSTDVSKGPATNYMATRYRGNDSRSSRELHKRTSFPRHRDTSTFLVFRERTYWLIVSQPKLPVNGPYPIRKRFPYDTSYRLQPLQFSGSLVGQSKQALKIGRMKRVEA